MPKLTSFARIGAAAGLVLSSAAVHATDIDWGLLADGDSRSSSQLHSPGTFTDTFSFSIGASSLDASAAVALNLTLGVPVYHISNGAYSLYGKGSDGAIGGGDDLSFGGWAFGGTTGDSSHTVSLATGDYYFAVSGLADGSAGGTYVISTAIAPIPEPETYAMLLTGLGLMGFVLRRQQLPELRPI